MKLFKTGDGNFWTLWESKAGILEQSGYEVQNQEITKERYGQMVCF